MALRPEELARAFCDVQWIDVHGKQRSVQDVTPALRAKVMLRDHGKCRVPGCRAAANIEVHHILPWSLGGTHTMENLIALCDGHHVAHHRGDILIEGPGSTATLTNLAAARADSIVHVDNRSDQIERDAVLALTGLGFTKSQARGAVGGALDEEPESFEQLVRAALRRCGTTRA